MLELVPTPNAVPTDRDTETRGMVVHSASPVSLGGPQPAALVGGLLLNQNLVFIDTINDLVYRAASLRAGSQGTATLFLDDVRITTNVRLFEGRRALGTRVSSAVRSTVLDQGKTWLDSAFVVNDWYISAYEPIIDSYGKRVGMLYVGFLEAPFIKAKYIDPCDHPGCVPFVTAAIVPIFLRWARAIFQPLERMTDTIAKVESGDLGARTGLPTANDEIGLVASHLESLLNRFRCGIASSGNGTKNSTRGSTSARGSCSSRTGSSKPRPSSSLCPKSSPRSAKSPRASLMRSTIRSRSCRAIWTSSAV